jgi:hypothetical protein
MKVLKEQHDGYLYTYNHLVPGEEAVVAYKTFRDSAIFANKRLIVKDAQGITGKKVEICSLPYSSIDM